jgi:hypothetical protein
MKQTHAQTDQAKKRHRPKNINRTRRKQQSHKTHQQPPSSFTNKSCKYTNIFRNKQKQIKTHPETKTYTSRGSKQIKHINQHKTSRTNNKSKHANAQNRTQNTNVQHKSLKQIKDNYNIAKTRRTLKTNQAYTPNPNRNLPTTRSPQMLPPPRLPQLKEVQLSTTESKEREGRRSPLKGGRAP